MAFKFTRDIDVKGIITQRCVTMEGMLNQAKNQATSFKTEYDAFTEEQLAQLNEAQLAELEAIKLETERTIAFLAGSLLDEAQKPLGM